MTDKVKFNPSLPYNDLPLLPPDIELETGPVLKKALSAARALAELKGICETIPNPSILINSLVLQEAKSSSEIENVVTTSDALYKAFTALNQKLDPATKEVLRYRTALLEAYMGLKKRPVLSTNLFVEIVQSIKENTSGVRNLPGTKLVNDINGELIFTPPEGEKIIRDKLKNLEEYIHSDNDVDPLIKMAIIHYQFEAIHPFTDGNGRTGRIINILYLIQNGLLDIPILYLSKYIIENKDDYYRLLLDVTKEYKWEPWLLYMLDAIEKTSDITRVKIENIRSLLKETIDYTKQKLPSKVYSKDLIELLFYQPYTKVQSLVSSGIVKRQTAAEYLKELEKIGVLILHKSGKENLYLNQKLYDLLGQ